MDDAGNVRHRPTSVQDCAVIFSLREQEPDLSKGHASALTHDPVGHLPSFGDCNLPPVTNNYVLLIHIKGLSGGYGCDSEHFLISFIIIWFNFFFFQRPQE